MDDLLDLARTYGTPLYVFDGRVLQARIDRLRAALPPRVELCYAVKANPFLVPLLADSVSRFEACSTGEARICLMDAAHPNTLVVSGVNKDAAFIEELIAGDAPVCRYTVESRLQFDLLLSCARTHGKRIPLLLRLTSGNQFGLSKQELCAIVRDFADDPNLSIEGVQYFSGTQKTSTKRLARELRQVQKVLTQLEDDLGFTCNELEFGPGFPVPYFSDEEFDEAAYLAEFSSLINNLAFDGPISLELGRSIAASCGTFLTSVADLKCNDGQHYAIVDGGMNHLVYYGQSLAMRQPTCLLLRDDGCHTPINLPDNNTIEQAGCAESAGNACGTDDAASYCICGSLCSINDILAKQLVLPTLELGDVLAFQNAGAYCMTEGISLFLSRDLPRICLIDAQGAARIVREACPTFPLNSPFPDQAR